MSIVVLDSSAYIYYVTDKLFNGKDEMVCEEVNINNPHYKLYKCRIDDKDLILSEASLRAIINTSRAKEYKEGNKILIKADKKHMDKLKRVSEELESVCKHNTCLVVPELPISRGKAMVNTFVYALNGRYIIDVKDDYNKEIRDGLKELNAKILLDEDLSKFIGKDNYERVLDTYFKLFGRDNIYIDKNNIIDPILKLEIHKGKCNYEVTIDVDKGDILVNGKYYGNLKEQPAYKSILKELLRSSVEVQDSVEGVKSLLSVKDNKLKTYYSGKGAIDVYLKAITNDNIKVFTVDKDIVEQVGEDIKEGNKYNIVLYKFKRVES